MLFEEMFQISKEPRDAFDVHAGAFETAAMREMYPEAVRENALIPNGYVGDPKCSQYIETNLKEADRRIARDIVNSFGKQVNGNYEQRNKPDAKDAELFLV